MELNEIESWIKNIDNDTLLYEPKFFESRANIIDSLEVEFMGINGSLPIKSPENRLHQLKKQAEEIVQKLENVNNVLFKKLRDVVRKGRHGNLGFKNLISPYLDSFENNNYHELAYTNLDILVNGIINIEEIPEQTKALEPEMAYYQKTPAGIIFDLVERSKFSEDDVFVDVGSGLGTSAILIHLLSGRKLRGIEYEPAFCNYARNCAEGLNLSGVCFENTDAREADYSEGTIFYLYTPCFGAMLKEILELLRREALKRKIQVFACGSCSSQIALQSWLTRLLPTEGSVNTLSGFVSI